MSGSRSGLIFWIAVAIMLVVAFNLWPALASPPLYSLLLGAALIIGLLVTFIRNRKPKP